MSDTDSSKLVIRGCVKEINVTLRDKKTGDPIDLSTADYIKACFQKEGGGGFEIRTPLNEVQEIDYSSVPDSGSFTLSHDGNPTSSLPSTANAADIQNALNALASLSEVIVTGDFANGHTVTYAGADGNKNQPLLIAGSNTLQTSGSPVVITLSVTTKGAKESIKEIDYVFGKFAIKLDYEDTLMLQTGLCKDMEIKWEIDGDPECQKKKDVFNVEDSLCS